MCFIRRTWDRRVLNLGRSVTEADRDDRVDAGRILMLATDSIGPVLAENVIQAGQAA
jgi:hypothetical protein